MNIKVLIVDDEKLERVLLRKGLAWEKKGFEIIGEAASAGEALEFVQHRKPELVLTDISMTGMDGLELSEEILKLMPGCHIVIVTGYREFEYARKAVQIGVEDFLLKPVDMKDLENITEKIRSKIEKEKEHFQEAFVFSVENCFAEKADDYISEYIGQMKAADRQHWESRRTRQGNKIVEEALTYINENMFHPDLSLKLVASKIYTNESYLSRIFKKEIGLSLIEYISKKRIDESVRLLNSTDLKVYEIAERIGFRDPHYFSICFKKQTGMTIKQFKNGKQ